MATEYIDQVSVQRAALYDGTNAAEIVANFNSEVVSEVGGVLTYAEIGIPGIHYFANVGQYINWSSEVNPSTNFSTDGLIPFPLVALQETGPIPVYSELVVTGSSAIPASLLPATQTIDVTLSGAMPSLAFVPSVSMRVGPSILPSVLSGHGISSAVPLTTSSVRVLVRSGAASLAGASLYVVARALIST